MATHKSAQKRARQAVRRRERRRHWRSRVKTAVKDARGSDSVADRSEKLRAAESVIRRAASKGAIPKRRANRVISRLARPRDRAGA